MDNKCDCISKVIKALEIEAAAWEAIADENQQSGQIQLIVALAFQELAKKLQELNK